MKKVLVFLLAGMLLLALCAPALAASKPGDTVKISISFNSSASPVVARVGFQVDGSGLEFVSAEGANGWICNGKQFSASNIGGVSNGVIGSVTVRVKSGAASGTYSVSASVLFAGDINETRVSASASGGSVTVEAAAPATPVPQPPTPAPCTHANTQWQETKAATCTEQGARQQVCTACKAVLKTEAIPAKGHANTQWQETKAATCTEQGARQQVCTACKAVLKTEAIPAKGHDQGKWVVTKKATKTETGEKALKCTVCGAVLKTETIPVVTAEWMYNQTACTLGLRFRDVQPQLTDKWYMFTPLDLSADGTQTLDIIGANRYVIGKATVKVENGKMTVSLSFNRGVVVQDKAMALVSSLADITNVEIASLTQQPLDTAIDVPGEKALLYVLCHVDYDVESNAVEWFSNGGAAYDALAQQLKALMN